MLDRLPEHWDEFCEQPFEARRAAAAARYYWQPVEAGEAEEWLTDPAEWFLWAEAPDPPRQRRSFRQWLRDAFEWLFLITPESRPYDWEAEGEFPLSTIEALARAQRASNAHRRAVTNYMRGDEL